MKYVTFDAESGVINAVLGNPTRETTEIADNDPRYITYIEARQAEEYIEERTNMYPPIGDQLDALFHAGVFPEEMASKLAAVKATYPKPD
mgnify:CR=1 FL=1